MSEAKFTHAWFAAQRLKEARRALRRRGDITPAQLLAAVDEVKAKRAQADARSTAQPRQPRGQPEHLAQVAVVTWAALAKQEFPELGLLFAIPNGGHRNVIVARKLKAEGVRAGVPDLMLPVARGKWHGLFIEMKAGKNQPSAEQSALLLRLDGQGYLTAVCHSSESAILLLREYLSP